MQTQDIQDIRGRIERFGKPRKNKPTKCRHARRRKADVSKRVSGYSQT